MRTFGCTESRRSSSGPMEPLAPVTATLIMADLAGELTLRVLELRARAGLSVLLALLHPRIAGEEAGPLEGLAELVVELQQRAGDAVTDRPRLAGGAGGAHVHDGVELPHRVGELQRLGDHHPQRLAREVVLEGAPVDQDAALAGMQPDAGDGGLAASGSVEASDDGHGAPQRARALVASGSGFWAAWGCSAPL